MFLLTWIAARYRQCLLKQGHLSGIGTRPCEALSTREIDAICQRWMPLGEGIEFSTVVIDRNGQLLRPYATVDGRWRLPATAKDVDPRYLDLVTRGLLWSCDKLDDKYLKADVGGK